MDATIFRGQLQCPVSSEPDFSGDDSRDDVYAELDPHNVTVVGGQVSHVGEAGFTLGEGGRRSYSKKKNLSYMPQDTLGSPTSTD